MMSSGLRVWRSPGSGSIFDTRTDLRKSHPLSEPWSPCPEDEWMDNITKVANTLRF